MRLRYALSIVVVALLLMANACETSDDVQSAKQEVMLMQATRAVGMPAITNFQERRMLKEILELRDQTIATTTYIMDLYGKLHKVCDSIGYGLPYATQFTNPSRYSGNNTTLPQADPNGLFSPSSAEGTWINCTDPATKQARVVYIEPRVVVSPFPLNVD